MAKKKYPWETERQQGVYYCPCCQRRVYIHEWWQAKEALCEYCGTPIKSNTIQQMRKIIKVRFAHAPEDTFKDSFKVWMGWKIPKMQLDMQYGIDVTEEEKREYARTHGIR